MPGTPPTSPRFGIARYADTDTAAFSAQVNAVTDGFDLHAAKKLAPTAKAAAYTAVDGDLVVVTAVATITLPAHSAGQIVGIMNLIGSGGGVVTVDGTNIQGKGLTAATTFPLGAYGSRVVLIDDGTNWLMIEGEQDSGWEALGSFASGVTTPASDGGFVAASRLQGDLVRLSGGLSNTTSTIAQNTPIAALAASIFYPSAPVILQSQVFSHYGGGAPGSGNVTATATGLVTLGTTGLLRYGGSASWPVNQEISLDGLSYRIT